VRELNMKAALTSLVLCLLVLGGSGIPAGAKNVYYDQKHGYWYCHPYVKRGTIGAGIGGATGAVLSSRGERLSNAARGAIIGGGVGLGYEYLRKKGVFGNNASDNPNCN